MVYKDIIFENGDISIRNGDFVVSDSEEQEVETILSADKGQIPLVPEIGFGIGKKLKGAIDRVRFESELTAQLKLDNIAILTKNISFDSNGKLVINISTQRER